MLVRVLAVVELRRGRLVASQSNANAAPVRPAKEAKTIKPHNGCRADAQIVLLIRNADYTGTAVPSVEPAVMFSNPSMAIRHMTLPVQDVDGVQADNIATDTGPTPPL